MNGEDIICSVFASESVARSFVVGMVFAVFCICLSELTFFLIDLLKSKFIKKQDQ